MLKKKQYLMTLLIGILLFFILFLIGYYYMKNTTLLTERVSDPVVSRNEKSRDVLAKTEMTQKETVQLDTHIHLLIVDENDNTIEDKNIDPLSLLGLSELELQDKFKGYEMVAFNEREIALKKTVAPISRQVQYTQGIEYAQGVEYALGIQDDLLCIVENGETKQYTKLNLLATQFSRRIYSLLLKEQIKISLVQKDELLSNPAYIEEILQSFEEE